MTNPQIITQFESLIDDTLDATLELQLANDAKNEIETDLQLEILKKIDTSNTTISGTNYSQAYNLPADFFLPLGPIWAGNPPQPFPYFPVPFSMKLYYYYTPFRYFIDMANSNFYLCGTQNAALPISIPYISSMPDINSSSSTSVVWPARFHSLIPFRMAQMYFAIDGGAKERAWDDRYGQFYKEKLNKMIDWDAKLKLNAASGSAEPDQAFFDLG